jgi:hypothetical protein
MQTDFRLLHFSDVPGRLTMSVPWGRLAALHARDRDGIPDAVSSRFHLAAGEARGPLGP